MEFLQGQNFTDGALYFFKFPLLALLYLFVFLALKWIIQSLPSKEQLRQLERGGSEGDYLVNSASTWASSADHLAYGLTQESMMAVTQAPHRARRLEAKPPVTQELARTNRGDTQVEVAPATQRDNRHDTMTFVASKPSPLASLSEPEVEESDPATNDPDAQSMPECQGFLQVVTGAGLNVKRITIDKEITFGRLKDCTVRLQDMFVSGHHAKISLSDAGPILSDLGSRNGTFCGDSALKEPHLLKDGQAFSIGDSVFRYHKVK